MENKENKITEKDFENQNINIFKSILASLFWIVLVIMAEYQVVGWALLLIATSSTIAFVFGIIMLFLCIIVLFFVIDYHSFKIKKMIKIKKIN